MVNTAAAQSIAGDGWVIAVMPNSGRPVTHWLVVGPYHDAGLATDGQDHPEWLFDDEEATLTHVHGLAEDSPCPIRVVVYPADPMA